ncbi:MAG: type II and III secretion system protein [Proteobacteria bacterium]|nr:type II and III secretion system protein [Pseudomonadota bacterium]
MIKNIILFAVIMFIFGCAEIEPKPFESSSGHINVEESPSTIDSDIPELVEQVPVLPEPVPVEPPERYTVVVNEVPVKELLFALARDAKVNVDIHPDIEGVVTINAVEQTLPQILKRISSQVDIRYEQDGNNLVISKDMPFFRTYDIDYVNLSRETSSTSSVSTQISSASGGDTESSSGGGNTSTTDVSTISNHYFWENLVSAVQAILGHEKWNEYGDKAFITDSVIPNPESGILSVKATASQHEKIQSFIDQVLVSAKRQVLIQITIAEVTLNERYQAGIDWNILSTGAFNIASVTAAGIPAFATAAASSFVIRNDESDGRNDNIDATITLLDEFGDTKILSSPQIMALNNQTALLKVVENRVYFEVETDTTSTQGVVTTTVDTTAKTVPVGIVMTVTPQIDSSGSITLVVRPTISRFTGNVNDPNPNLALPNPVPQIAVREMESVLRMTDGQVGVLGGLMTDENKDNDAGLPGAKKLDLFGNLFKTASAEYTKSELVIFIKPTIISSPSIDDDLQQYRKYLSNDYRSSDKKTGQGENAL